MAGHPDLCFRFGSLRRQGERSDDKPSPGIPSVGQRGPREKVCDAPALRDAAVGPRAGARAGQGYWAESRVQHRSAPLPRGLKEPEGEKRETKVPGEETPSPRKTRLQRGGWIQRSSGSTGQASLSRAGGGPGCVGPALLSEGVGGTEQQRGPARAALT